MQASLLITPIATEILCRSPSGYKEICRKVLLIGSDSAVGEALARLLAADHPTICDVTECPTSAVSLADIKLRDIVKEGDDVTVFACRGSEKIVNALLEEARRPLAGKGTVRVVYCSDAGVVFSGDLDLKDAPEAGLPLNPLLPCLQEVAEAERIVLGANDSRSLRTCVVRPALLYGPAAPQEKEDAGRPSASPFSLLHYFAGAAARHRDSSIKRVGEGRNVADLTFAGNAAHSMLLAASALGKQDSPAAGKAYFVTDGDTQPFWGVVHAALTGLGYRGVEGSLPLWWAQLCFWFLHVLALLLPFLKLKPATFAKEVAVMGVKDQSYSIDAARRDLSYTPLWTRAEGMMIALQGQPSLRNPLAVVRHEGPFTKEEVARHNNEDDVWIIVDDKVYDVTLFVEAHPGGNAILKYAGGDSTVGMNGPQHPAQAREILETHYIGDLVREDR